MRVALLIYGALQNVFACERMDYDSPGPDVEDLLDALCQSHPEFKQWRDRVACAVGDTIVRPGEQLNPQDEIALIPPVGGG